MVNWHLSPVVGLSTLFAILTLALVSASSRENHHHHHQHHHHHHASTNRQPSLHKSIQKRSFGKPMRIWTPSQGPSRRSATSDGKALEPFEDDSYPGWTFDHIYDVPFWDGGDKSTCPSQTPSKSTRTIENSVHNHSHPRIRHRRQSATVLKKADSNFCRKGNAPTSVPDDSTCRKGTGSSEGEARLERRLVPTWGSIQQIIMGGIDAGRQVKLARAGSQPGGVPGGASPSGPGLGSSGLASLLGAGPGSNGMTSLLGAASRSGGTGAGAVPGGTGTGIGTGTAGVGGTAGGVGSTGAGAPGGGGATSLKRRLLPTWDSLQQIIMSGIDAGRQVDIAKARAQAGEGVPGPDPAGGSGAAATLERRLIPTWEICIGKGIDAGRQAGQAKADAKDSGGALGGATGATTPSCIGSGTTGKGGAAASLRRRLIPTWGSLQQIIMGGIDAGRQVKIARARAQAGGGAQGGATGATAPQGVGLGYGAAGGGGTTAPLRRRTIPSIDQTDPVLMTKRNHLPPGTSSDVVPPSFFSSDKETATSDREIPPQDFEIKNAVTHISKRLFFPPMMGMGGLGGFGGGAGMLTSMMPAILSGIEGAGKLGGSLADFLEDLDKQLKLKGEKNQTSSSTSETGSGTDTDATSGGGGSESGGGSASSFATGTGAETVSGSGGESDTSSTGDKTLGSLSSSSSPGYSLYSSGSENGGESGGGAESGSGSVSGGATKSGEGASGTSGTGGGTGSTSTGGDTSSANDKSSGSLGSSTSSGSSSTSPSGFDGTSSGSDSGTSAESYSPGKSKRDETHRTSPSPESPQSPRPPPSTSNSNSATSCGGDAHLCMQIIEHAFPYCHSSTTTSNHHTREESQTKQHGSKFGDASSKLIRSLILHCSLKCVGFTDLVEADPGFKKKAEGCTGDRSLFNKKRSSASAEHDAYKHHEAQTSKDRPQDTKAEEKLHKRQASASPKEKCSSGYQTLFANAMRPVPSYSNKRFGSVVSDPSSFLHWGLVRNVQQCLQACDATDGCVFVNIYQQVYSLENPSIKLIQRSTEDNESIHGKQGDEKDKDTDGTGKKDELEKGFAKKPERKKNSFVQGNLTCALYSRCHLECEANRASGDNLIFFEHSVGFCKSKACQTASSQT